MEVSPLPCDELDRISRNFVWGGQGNQRKIHMLSWDEICKPEEAGGLGLRSARKINHAFMMKVGWNICVDSSALWVQVTRAKYGCGENLIHSSNFWRGICKSWGDVHRNVIWRVGQGDRISFWTDYWVPNQGPLNQKALGPITNEDLASRVRALLFLVADGIM